MRLKLLAPFSTPELSLRDAEILQAPRSYALAWTAAEKALAQQPEILAGQEIISCKLAHSRHFSRPSESRYRDIESHSLLRPLQVLELVVRPSGEHASRLLAATAPESSSSVPGIAAVEQELRRAFDHGEVPLLVRVFDHRVSLLELDLPLILPPDVGTTPGKFLDLVQRRAIDLAESWVNELCDQLLLPLFEWLRSSTEAGRRFVEDWNPDGPLDGSEQRRARTLWVTRSLILTSADDLGGVDGDDSLRRAFVAHWLKDTHEAPDLDDPRLTSPSTYSMRWLNYFYAEDTYPNPYPESGWHDEDQPGEPRLAQPFSYRWEAMIISQYYYAAFDLAQSRVSQILALSVSPRGSHKLSLIRDLLDRAIHDSNMLKIEYQENLKYFSVRVVTEVETILDGWAFEKRLFPGVESRLEDCVDRLQELHSRSVEHASLYTDLILLAIGITSVFSILLGFAEYGRSMAADAQMAVYETSSVGAVDWLAATSTDALMLAGFVLSLGLIFLYAFFRSHREL